MNVVHLTDNNFTSEVINAKTPVLVDFWAEWCGPCKRIAPVIEEIAKEYVDKLKVAKLNVDDGRKTASKFGIMSIPTLMLFKDGKIAQQTAGVISKKELKSMIEANI